MQVRDPRGNPSWQGRRSHEVREVADERVRLKPHLIGVESLIGEVGPNGPLYRFADGESGSKFTN